jgi:hypothetical protein
MGNVNVNGGALVFDAQIDLTNLDQGVAEINDKLNKTAETAVNASKKQQEQIVEQVVKFQDVNAQIDKMQQKIGGLGKTPVKGLQFEADVNIDKGVDSIKKLADTWNSLGDKTQKGQFIDAFTSSIKDNIKELSASADSLKEKLRELESVPIGKQDFEGIKNLNTELTQTESAIGFLTQLTGNLDQLPESFNKSAGGATRLMTQLRQLKDDLAAMKEEGKGATPEFASKLDQATHLEHAIKNVNKELELSSSNVAGLNALKEGFRGLIGGAETFAGAMGLLTDDESKAQVITKNLIALQSVLNGVEEVGAILDKNSALNVYLLSLQRKLAGTAAVEQAAGEEVLAVAQTEGVVATEAATAAQVGLNAAILANPVGIILASIVALYGAYEILSNTIFKASDAERQREASLRALKEAEDKAAESQAAEEGNLNILIATAKNKVLTDEQRGRALDELRAQYPQYLSNLTLENVYTKEASEAIAKQTELIKARAFERAAEEVFIETLKEQVKKQNELNDAIRTGGTTWEKFKALLKTGGVGGAESRDAVVLNSKIEDLNDAAIKTSGAFETFQQVQNELAGKMGNTTVAINEQASAWTEFGRQVGVASLNLSGILTQGNKTLKDVLGSVHRVFDPEEFEAQKKRINETYQYEVDKTKEGTAANLKARLEMQKALLAVEKQNPALFDNLGSPKIDQQTGKASANALKILGEFGKQISDINDQISDKALQNATAAANSLVLMLQAAGQQGTDKYFDAQANALRKGAAEQIVQAKDNAGKILEIQQKLNLDLVNLDKERQRQQLENEKSLVQVRINGAKEGSQEELKLRLEQLDINAREEELQAGKNQDKLLEIRSNAEKQKAELVKKYAIEAAETETNIQIALIERHLSSVRNGSDEELNLKKQLVDQKAALDIDEKKKQIKNEQLLAAEIDRIYSQTLRDKKKLEDEFVAGLLQRQFKLLDNRQAANNVENNFVINDPRSTNTQKAQAELNKLNEAGVTLQLKINAITNQIIGNKGDINELSSQLDALQTQQDQNKNDQALQKLKLSIAKLQDIQNISDKIGASFKTLSTSVAAFDKELSAALETMSQLAASVSGVVKGLADFKTAKSGKGDLIGEISSITGIVSAAITAITLLINTVKGSFDSIKKAKQDVIDFDYKLGQGELAYQEMLRARERMQATFNKLTLDGIAAQEKLLETQKKTTTQQSDDLLKQIQGLTYVTGETVKKKQNLLANVLFGVGGQLFKNGSVDQVTASLAGKSFDQLEELFTKGQLVGKAKDLFEQLKQLHDEGADIDQQLSDLKEKAAETFTGTTFGSITDSIADGFKNGLHSAADFAGTFEDLMRQAMISSLKFQYLEPAFKNFFEQFSAASQSGGILDQSEIANLQTLFNSTINDFDKKVQQFEQISGINLQSSVSGRSTNSLQGAIKSITEDTAELIAGNIGALRLTAIQQLNIMQQALTVQQNIANNTGLTVSEMRKLYSLLNDVTNGSKALKIQ